MKISRLAATAVLISLFGAVAACSGGGEKSASEVKNEVSDALRSGSSALSEEDADCFADVIVEEVGVERLEDVDFDAEEPPAEIEDDFGAAVLKALEECDVDLTTDGDEG